MKRYHFPTKKNWLEICSRPTFDNLEFTKSVKTVLENVKTQGDTAIYDYTEKFDGVKLNKLIVSDDEIQKALNLLDKELKIAIQKAKRNIEKFHLSQKEKIKKVETSEGVVCWRKSIGIEKVGLYIPGGSAPLFSTVLMLGIPAVQAGCKEIVLCTPPNQNNEINPVILYTAQLVGITKIFKIGGAQAIGAMAYGTESVPRVYKIFGPGNQYVTKAKELIQQEGVAIDMPAGPSELLVIADKTCNPAFVAADLLSQAEHGPDSQVVLLSCDAEVLEKTTIELMRQVKELPRKEIALAALENSKSVLCASMDQCIELSNVYAPEHLIIAVDNADQYANWIENAGSVFLGNYSCESAGDYASGTNHTLPTNGYAKNYSGVSYDSFVRKITFQKLTSKGLQNIGPSIEIMAEAEGLYAHKNAVSLRLKSLQNV